MRGITFSFLLSLFVLMTAVTSAQAQSPAPAAAVPAPHGQLEVLGTGRTRVQPDQTMVFVQVQNTNTEAGRAVQLVTEQVERLLKKLQDAGFKKEEIKTSQFYLNENNEWRDGQMYRNGYTASQTLEVKFPLDQKRMTKLTNAFAETQEGVTFRFSFGLSDKLQQQVKEELIRKALQDARENAAVIARSMNIRLGSIHKIDYGRQQGYPMPMAEMRSANMVMDKQAAQFPQTEVQDIELSDQVVVIWNLE